MLLLFRLQWSHQFCLTNAATILIMVVTGTLFTNAANIRFATATLFKQCCYYLDYDCNFKFVQLMLLLFRLWWLLQLCASSAANI
jgi:hypothetical protein